ncbi:hypothetical protein POM88_019926 [Heracleum sosnowskyi]|uniref:Expansin-like EG45 domain-containing protein n=1 Tax=Heracleum sosnowskyi TaxID=360622 RepID=A0AAD8IAW5_9APIA|nr:hypothetical protein POM88_019926 [Heracleum sosnowskyi]
MDINKIIYFLILAVVSSSFTSVNSTIIAANATYYSTYTPSACFGDEDRGSMVVALNPDSFNFSLCGKFIRVQCAFGMVQPEPCRVDRSFYVTAEIVHICPPAICPGSTDIALSEQLYTALIDLNKAEYMKVYYELE